MDSIYASKPQSDVASAGEYYGRVLRLKPFILGDRAMISRIKGTFTHQYLGEALPEDIMVLGHGQMHSVYSVGAIDDSIDGRKIHVALRVVKKRPYMLEGPDAIRELGAFERAFNTHKNPPYFTGIVAWNNEGPGKLHRQSAILITEDISQGKALRIVPKFHEDREFVMRANPDGSPETFFIDPFYYEDKLDTETGEKYASDEARIDLPW
ncbi:MAG: hypothetical protein HYX24_06180 [Candidatus Aenigmarchaeota archaeon]|nr:hypothetical protein [Candidatus Aenigmarchaeota archaeon]